ncbi:MAG TPA: TlpA disulfide reductase family protein, partial [Verrucomicrobiae bacterium]|nr:TlpA disulfide reductase family protein [Verrucomicrobiae bacterium]
PIDLAAGKGKNIYVIEFFATWHAPSREAIPHITELQSKFRDRGVVVVALTDEAPSLVKVFVDKMGAKMEYAIGIDEREKAFKTYTEPFDESGIPHAFIIDKEGRLVWHGYPSGSLDKALEEVLSGKFNLQQAKTHDRITKLQIQYINAVNAPATRAKAAEIGETIITELANNAAGLNFFAWRILTDRRIEHRDAALALKAASSAYAINAGKDPAVVDTYARALFESGDKQAAIAQQKAAIRIAKDEVQRIEFESTLKKYQRLLRESAN